jgi:uncharacterized RDD family membrane protein YckC
MDDESTAGAPAGLFRRLASLFYDLLLVIAIAFAVTFALLPLTDGEAILASTGGFAGHLYRALMLLLAFGYFALSWTRGGQTLGMKAWRIRVRAADGSRLGFGGATFRFATGALFGWLAVLGFWLLARPGDTSAEVAAALLFLPALMNALWIAFDRESRSLQDLAGRARVSRLARGGRETVKD